MVLAFSAAAAPANRTRCQRQCTRRSAPASSASTLLRQPLPTFTTSISKVRAASSQPAAATRARGGCHRGGGWNGRTAQCACSFLAKNRNRCAVHSASFASSTKLGAEGTRLGRQELQGAMILDPQNALFKDEWLIHNDVPEDIIEQVTVGVDPSG